MASGSGQSKLLDLAFAMDCTGSMSSQIQQAKDNIRQIVEEIVSKESADVHLALVEYRDHPPQDSTFITRPHDFTSSVRTMKGWLEQCSAEGGGDGPEAVADALHDLVKLSWRPGSTRVAVFITDAPPHGIGQHGDTMPNGCPLGLDPLETTRKLAAKAVTVYTVGCSVDNMTRDFLMSIAHMTGGQYVPLNSATLLAKVIVGGACEEISLQELMDEVNREVEEEIEGLADGEVADQEEVTKNIFSKLKSRGVKATRMQQQSATGKTTDLPTTSEAAKKLSNMASLAEWRKEAGEEEENEYGGYSRGYSGRSRRGGRGRGGGGGGGRSKWAKKKKKGAATLSEGAAAEAEMDEPSEAMADVVNVEEDISYEQAYRMVTKSVAVNKLGAKVTKSKK